MSQRHDLYYMEMHINHDCNLKCKGCTHFCNYGYKGHIAHEEGAEWIKNWGRRMNPQHFRLLGGEPLLHKELDKYIVTAAEAFPEAERSVVSNGLLVRNIEHLFPLFMETGTRLTISFHPMTPRQERIFNDSLTVAYKWHLRGMKLGTSRNTEGWISTYQGEGAKIRPFNDGRPEDSLKACISAKCINIHQGKLWRCPTLAFLPLVVDQLEFREEWEPYLAYNPLPIEASDAEVADFIKCDDVRFCNMCPAQRHYIQPEGIIPDNIYEMLINCIGEQTQKAAAAQRTLEQERANFAAHLKKMTSALVARRAKEPV